MVKPRSPRSNTPRRSNKLKLGIICGTILSLFFCLKNILTSNNSQTKAYWTNKYVTTAGPHKRPFEMPIKGDKFEIFQPIYDMDTTLMDPQLIAPAKEFIANFQRRLEWVNTMIADINATNDGMATEEYAALMYLEMIKSFVSGSVFNAAEKSVHPMLNTKEHMTSSFNLETRKGGRDWTYAGDTMTGWKRLDNVRDLLFKVLKDDVKGDYIETGVWRGGSSILARAVMNAKQPSSSAEKSHRVSYVCDSFSGLPPGERSLDAGDKNWDNTPYLEVSTEVVANNFAKYGLLDSNVVFVKGFFSNSMPSLSKQIESLSIMRLDGDMYESTVDVLYHLYDKLSIDGYVIIDDWFGFPAKTACEDFFKVHGINPKIIAIDEIAAYWKKEEHVDIHVWRYEQSKFKDGDTKTQHL